MPTISTVVLLYLLGYLPPAPLPPGIAPPMPHLQCKTFTDSEYLASEEDILDQLKEPWSMYRPHSLIRTIIGRSQLVDEPRSD
jgi:hypothetical protein